MSNCSSYNSPEDALYSTSVEIEYGKLVKSLPSTFTVQHASPENDKYKHVDVFVIDKNGTVWFDDVKTVRPNNRKCNDTNYVISYDTYKFVLNSGMDSDLKSRYRLVLERYDKNGNPRNSFLRFRWSDLIENASGSFRGPYGDFGKEYMLFDPNVAIKSGAYPEVVEPDIQ